MGAQTRRRPLRRRGYRPAARPAPRPTNPLAVSPTQYSLTAKLLWAERMAQSDRLPREYRRNPANCFWLIEYAAEIGLEPLETAYSIYWMGDKPTASANLIAVMVRRAGHRLDTQLADDGRSATSTLTRADTGQVFTVRWDYDKARQAGLIQALDQQGRPVARAGKNDTPTSWMKFPGVMLQHRTITEVARLHAQDALIGGVRYSPEELGALVDEDGIPVYDNGGEIQYAQIEAQKQAAEEPQAVVAQQIAVRASRVRDVKSLGALWNQASHRARQEDPSALDDEVTVPGSQEKVALRVFLERRAAVLKAEADKKAEAGRSLLEKAQRSLAREGGAAAPGAVASGPGAATSESDAGWPAPSPRGWGNSSASDDPWAQPSGPSPAAMAAWSGAVALAAGEAADPETEAVATTLAMLWDAVEEVGLTTDQAKERFQQQFGVELVDAKISQLGEFVDSLFAQAEGKESGAVGEGGGVAAVADGAGGEDPAPDSAEFAEVLRELFDAGEAAGLAYEEALREFFDTYRRAPKNAPVGLLRAQTQLWREQAGGDTGANPSE
ncbi:hypothetical protein ACFC1T_09055 [Kitasatospora sp. NPDC056076]|uniref:hypothetical protein n=1 Tax=Kitasatospora sp. NPDC056076 TaxID=3345703 RepID=UPI0035D8DC6B